MYRRCKVRLLITERRRWGFAAVPSPQEEQHSLPPEQPLPPDDVAEPRALQPEQPPPPDDDAGQSALPSGEVGARGGPSHEGPTPTNRENRRLMHMPFEDWCYECVSGRGRDAAHPCRKLPAVGPPVMQMITR